MSAVKTMRVVQTDSHGPAHFIAFAVTLVNYVHAELPGSVLTLTQACEALWPKCDVYRGGTHLRVTINPELPWSCRQSFYVDLSGERRAP